MDCSQNVKTFHGLLRDNVVTGQFADKPTCGQSSWGLVNSRTSQLAQKFDLNFAVTNCYKYDLW